MAAGRVTAKLEGGNLIITIPTQPKHISGTGKTMTVAGTGGFGITDVVVDGYPVMVMVNTYLKGCPVHG